MLEGAECPVSSNGWGAVRVAAVGANGLED